MCQIVVVGPLLSRETVHRNLFFIRSRTSPKVSRRDVVLQTFGYAISRILVVAIWLLFVSTCVLWRHAIVPRFGLSNFVVGTHQLRLGSLGVVDPLQQTHRVPLAQRIINSTWKSVIGNTPHKVLHWAPRI